VAVVVADGDEGLRRRSRAGGDVSGRALNRVRWPALDCFWTGMIFITSSFNLLLSW